MNIFVLDENPIVAARMMCDKHVVKMIVESGQMLSTVHRVLDGTEWTDYAKNGRRIKRWKSPYQQMETILIIGTAPQDKQIVLQQIRFK